MPQSVYSLVIQRSINDAAAAADYVGLVIDQSVTNMALDEITTT
jgi:hypothetical protein